MVTKFERIFFDPKVYLTFTVNNEAGEAEEFIIQDLPLELIDEAVEFMIRYYARDEVFSNAIKVSESELKKYFEFVFRKKCGIACFTVKTHELVGINALSVKTKGLDLGFKVTNFRQP